MIVGVGVEWVDVPRFEAVAARFGKRIQLRLFTRHELAFSRRRSGNLESLAVRFAAKVAARRALGLDGARWRDVEVVRADGRPELRFYGRADERARRLKVRRVSLTLTHDAAHCIGQVVLEDER